MGRVGGVRELHPHPEQVIIAQLKNCPQCGEQVTAAAQKLQSVYEKIELPPFAPSSPESNVMVVSVRAVKPNMLHLCHCPCNQVHLSSSSIQSLVTYPRYTHAISYEGLSSILASVFGLKISVGAIANLLVKVKTNLDDLCKSNIATVGAGKINL